MCYCATQRKMAEQLPHQELVNLDEAILNQMDQIQKEVAEASPLVGELEDVSGLSREYQQSDQVYQLKVKDLASVYAKVRRTRGDGNCFFRAFAFACMEKLLNKELAMKKFRESVDSGKLTVSELGYPSFTVEDFHENFMEVVDSLETEGMTVTELLKTFQDQGTSDYLVCYLRIIASGYLQKNSEFYLPFLNGYADIKDFCSKEVEPMGHESDHIHVTALTLALGVNVRIQYMDRGEGGKVNHHDFPEGPLPDIHLLYRPGHYDILYLGQGVSSCRMSAVLPPAVRAPIELMSFWCADVCDPKQCSSLIQDLGQAHPLDEWKHLKRIRKKDDCTQLQILLAPSHHCKDTFSKNYEGRINNLRIIEVPKERPLTRKQYQESKVHWSVQFREDKELERKLSEKMWDAQTLSLVNHYMEEAVKEAKKAASQGEPPVGAVIVNFQTGQVIATGFPSRGHPTKHAVMVCIDKVSLAQGGGVWHDHASSNSLEPQAKRSKRNKDSNEYLCTGLQLFVTAEPCVMCSMALVHARIARVFYGVPNTSCGGLGSKYTIHCQPELNHHFDVYSHVLYSSCAALSAHATT